MKKESLFVETMMALLAKGVAFEKGIHRELVTVRDQSGAISLKLVVR